MAVPFIYTQVVIFKKPKCPYCSQDRIVQANSPAAVKDWAQQSKDKEAKKQAKPEQVSPPAGVDPVKWAKVNGYQIEYVD